MFVTDGAKIYLIQPERTCGWNKEAILEHAEDRDIMDYLEVVFDVVSNPENRKAAFLAQAPKIDLAWIAAAIQYFHGTDPIIVINDIISLGRVS